MALTKAEEQELASLEAEVKGANQQSQPQQQAPQQAPQQQAQKQQPIMQALSKLVSNVKGGVQNIEQRVGSGQAQQAVEQRQAGRQPVDVMQNLNKLTQGTSIQKAKAGIDIATDPFRRLEASMANPLLAAQRGEFDKIPSDFVEGVKGSKPGEFGDVYVGMGLDETTSSTLGLATELLIGGAIMSRGINSVGKALLKKSDKLGIRAVDDVLEGVDRATAASTLQTDTFWKGINSLRADVGGSLKGLSNLPKQVTTFIQRELGRSLDDVAKSATLGDLRTIKQAVGKLKPGSHTKLEKGLADSLNDIDIRRVYKALSETIETNLKNTKLGRSKIDKLLKVNQAAEDVIISSNAIKGNLLSSKLERKVAEGVQKTRTLSGVQFREDLRLLSTVARGAKSKINKGLVALNKIGQKEAMKQALSSFARVTAFGAVGGAAAGKGVSSALREATR